MWLVIRTGPDAGASAEVPDGATLVLGRQRGCDLIVRDSRASRRHAELTGADGGIRLRDLGSANGTYVDGRRVTEARLEGGEDIRIGEVVIGVTIAPPSRPGLAPERRGDTPAGATEAAAPQLATHSTVRRMIEAGTARAHRTALVAAGIAAVAVTVAAIVAVGLIGGGDEVPEVVAELAPSTVQVVTERAGTRTGTGSGWVLDAGAGLVVTNAHVVNEGTSARVAAAGRSRPAEVVGAAPCEDLALLRVRDTDGLRTARLGTGASVEQGETVVALGFGADAAAGDSVSSTTGVVSVPRTSFRDPAPDVPAYPDVVQTDTALNPGNSGGPLADLDGRVIGVNSAARTTGSDGRPLQNVNYAIAIDRARSVLADLQAGRGPGWTGLTFAYPTAGELQDAGLPAGLRVTGAVPGTPAAQAPIEPGDLLAGVNGRPIGTTLESLCRAMAGLRAGDEVVLSFARPGRSRTREVRLRLT